MFNTKARSPATGDGSSAKAMDSSHALFPNLHVVLDVVKDKIIDSLERILRSDLDTAVNLKGRVMCAKLRAMGRIRNHLEGRKVTVNKFIAGIAARSATHSYRKWPANSTGHPCIFCI